MPIETKLEFETLDKSEILAEREGSRWEPIGALTHEIDLEPQLTAADFSLDPPADFTFEKIAAPAVTEVEMVAYLKAAAVFNGNQFTDSPYLASDRDKLNAEWEKDESARSAEANQLIEIVVHRQMKCAVPFVHSMCWR